MTQIKMCGTTSRDDALAAVAAGADALGFVFFENSPRYVPPETVREICAALPPRVARVGVFVNEDPRTVRRIAAFCGLDFLQFHGDESEGYCRRFPRDVLLKAVWPSTEADLVRICRYRVRAFVVDGRDPARYGGTGRTADWRLAAQIGRDHPVVLAGGLNPVNVAQAIREVSPAAVDVASGVEACPGRKDPRKMEAFVARARLEHGKSSEPLFTVASERTDVVWRRPCLG